jgi:hypothetical protein
LVTSTATVDPSQLLIGLGAVAIRVAGEPTQPLANADLGILVEGVIDKPV